MDDTLALVIDVPCWIEYPGAHGELAFGEPGNGGTEIANRRWRCISCGDYVAPRNIDIGAQSNHHRLPGDCQVEWTVGGVDRLNHRM